MPIRLWMTLIWMVLSLTWTAAADSEAALEAIDWFLKPELYRGNIERGAREWPRLRDEHTLRLKPGTRMFSLPEYAARDGNVPTDASRRQSVECRTNGPVTGRAAHVVGWMVAVEVEGNPCPGTNFNQGYSNRDLVFVRSEQVTHVWGPRDAVTEARATEPRCRNCAKAELAILEAMSKAAENQPPPPGKTELELEEYMACYATRHQDDYRRHYRRLINLAANTFHVEYDPTSAESVRAISRPEQFASQGTSRPFYIQANGNVMKCLGLRESRWDRTAESPTGAMGIGQQTEPNVRDINCWLNGCQKRERRTVVENGRSVQREVIVNQPAFPWARQLWTEYFRKVRATTTPAEQAWLFRHPTTGARCTEEMAVKERDAFCPVNSIAAMALYQVMIEVQIRRNSNLYKDGSINDMGPYERFALWRTNAVSHNGGLGIATRTARKDDQPGNWVRRILGGTTNPARLRELSDYDRYMRNCLERDNWDPPGREPTKQCR